MLKPVRAPYEINSGLKVGDHWANNRHEFWNKAERAVNR